MTVSPAEGVRQHEARRKLAETFGESAFAAAEANLRELTRLQGCIDGLNEGSQRIEEHKAYWKLQLDEHKVEPEEVKVIYRTIDECRGILNNLTEGARIMVLKAQGAQAQAEALRSIAQSHFENESKAMQMILDEAQNPQAPAASGAGRQVGQHPGPSLAERRREAEENGMRVMEGGAQTAPSLTPKPKRRRKGNVDGQDS